jgi:hypothetical protein
MSNGSIPLTNIKWQMPNSKSLRARAEGPLWVGTMYQMTNIKFQMQKQHNDFAVCHPEAGRDLSFVI